MKFLRAQEIGKDILLGLQQLSDQWHQWECLVQMAAARSKARSPLLQVHLVGQPVHLELVGGVEVESSLELAAEKEVSPRSCNRSGARPCVVGYVDTCVKGSAKRVW